MLSNRSASALQLGSRRPWRWAPHSYIARRLFTYRFLRMAPRRRSINKPHGAETLGVAPGGGSGAKPVNPVPGINLVAGTQRFGPTNWLGERGRRSAAPPTIGPDRRPSPWRSRIAGPVLSTWP